MRQFQVSDEKGSKIFEKRKSNSLKKHDLVDVMEHEKTFGVMEEWMDEDGLNE